MTLAGDYAYFAGRILDISNPLAPREVDRTEAAQGRQQAAGDWLYDARLDGGLRILRRVALSGGAGGSWDAGGPETRHARR